MTAHIAEPDSGDKTLARLTDFYRHLDNTSLPQLSQIYHSQVVFIDPVGQHNGIAALENYFRQLLKTVNYCRFDVHQMLMNRGGATLLWRMDYSHPSLKKGQALSLEGVSHLRLEDNYVIYQRDYYDLGAMLYEHVPVLGHAVKALKARLKA